jgi:hypothetical protein
MAETEGIKEDTLGDKHAAALDVESLQRKKYKTSELPISQEQQTSMQNMLVAFKKKGSFDSYRKKIWQDFYDLVSFTVALANFCCLLFAYRFSFSFSYFFLLIRIRAIRKAKMNSLLL